MAKKTAKAKTAKKTGAKKKKAAKKAQVAAGGPPGGVLYRCDPSGAPGSNQCLRFNWNPKSQWWDTPPEGIPMNCSDCRWFFGDDTPRR